MSIEELDKNIRRVKDYPKKGINFYDITTILTNSEAFIFCIEELKKKVLKMNANAIIAIEARGFIFASPVAKDLALPMLLARKEGKLPGKKLTKEYALEYGVDKINIHESDLDCTKNYVAIDDLIATGGTLKAVSELIEENGCKMAGFIGVIGLPFLNYEEKLFPKKVDTIINYQI